MESHEEHSFFPFRSFIPTSALLLILAAYCKQAIFMFPVHWTRIQLAVAFAKPQHTNIIALTNVHPSLPSLANFPAIANKCTPLPTIAKKLLCHR